MAGWKRVYRFVGSTGRRYSFLITLIPSPVALAGILFLFRRFKGRYEKKNFGSIIDAVHDTGAAAGHGAGR